MEKFCNPFLWSVQRYRLSYTRPCEIVGVGLDSSSKDPFSTLYRPLHRHHSTNDGLRKLRTRSSRSSHCISYMFNIIVTVRLACYTSNCLDPNFKWFTEGKFTADAVAFNVVRTLATAAYLLHLLFCRITKRTLCFFVTL